MLRNRDILPSPRVVKMIGAIVMGLSIGALLPPEPMAVPAVGVVPGVLVGGLGLAGGALLYVQAPKWLRPSGCGCSDDCGCS